MNARRMLAFAAVLFAATLVAAPEAEARWGWRKARWSSGRTTNTYQAWQRSRRPSAGPLTYSGVSRAEQDFWRRRDAWYDHAYNGWRPEYFH